LIIWEYAELEVVRNSTKRELVLPKERIYAIPVTLTYITHFVTITLCTEDGGQVIEPRGVHYSDDPEVEEERITAQTSILRAMNKVGRQQWEVYELKSDKYMNSPGTTDWYRLTFMLKRLSGE
jgi:hypothetical protein